jgi:hypothetical protein
MADLSVRLGTLTVLGLRCTVIRVSSVIPEDYIVCLTITVIFTRSQKSVIMTLTASPSAL